METLIIVVLSMIATWRITYMLILEEGPGDIFKLLRTLAGVVDLEDGSREEEYNLKGIKKFFAGVFSCIYCMSIWVGGFFAIFVADNPLTFALYTLLYSSAAIFINLVHEKLIDG